ncbi:MULTISPECIES: glycosyltransferase family 4 protein [Frankia]|nr:MULTISPECIES: glycosyltransferase family 4 protein [Frankia]
MNYQNLGGLMVECNLALHYSGGLDANKWRERHGRGEVPDALPYGFDRLARYSVKVSPVSLRVSRDAFFVRGPRIFGGYEWVETAASRRTVGGSDVVLCWDERVGVPAALMAGTRNHPPVVTGVIWLADVAGRRPGSLKIARCALRRSSRIFTLSTAQIPPLRTQLGIPEGRFSHVLFGVDSTFFRTSVNPPKKGLVVSVGNDRHRDFETLIRGLSQGWSRLAELRLAELRLELVTARNVAVPPWLGRRRNRLTLPEVSDLYRAASMVVVCLRPNLHVSGVTVVLEAMASGRPVVVTDTPGIRDYVDHGRTGILVPPYDTDALAEAVVHLVLDPDRAAALGAAARLDVEHRLNTEAQARRFATLLREL